MLQTFKRQAQQFFEAMRMRNTGKSQHHGQKTQRHSVVPSTGAEYVPQAAAWTEADLELHSR
jgi:hypothetical protein